MRLPIYLRRLMAGVVRANAIPTVAHRQGSIAVVDGQDGLGPVAGVFAADVSAELALEHGVGAVVVKRSTHYGMAAYYVMRLASQRLVAFTASNVEPDVVPFGGAQPALGTNPIAFAAPAAQGQFVLDMATSQVAMGKIFLARGRAQSIPSGWAVDADGRVTTDAEAARAAMPLGGAKGYALAVMVEVLAGVLSGSAVGHQVGRMYDDWEKPQDVGHFFLTIDPDSVLGSDAFVERMSQLWRALKATPAAPGVDEVMVPGEPEARTRASRSAAGIAVPLPLYEELSAIGVQLGNVPEPRR